VGSKRPPTAAHIIRRAVERSYLRLVENEPGVLAGGDPEAVHQARVATRRLRSDLRTFEPFLAGRWAAGLRGELRWLGGDLGAVRDIEVMRERLQHHATSLPAGEADAVAGVLRRLDADHVAARADLVVSMQSSRYRDLTTMLADVAQHPRLRGRAKKPAGPELRHVLHARWRTLRRAVDDLGVNPPDEALHAVRIRAKRCRYAAEASVPAFGKKARRFGEAMADVQEVLGEHHDAVVSGAWLAKTAQECTSGQAYALGRLAQIEHLAALDARDEFFELWPDASRKRLRAWL
jgi:CHAD domain-containing protein